MFILRPCLRIQWYRWCSSSVKVAEGVCSWRRAATARPQGPAPTTNTSWMCISDVRCQILGSPSDLSSCVLLLREWCVWSFCSSWTYIDGVYSITYSELVPWWIVAHCQSWLAPSWCSTRASRLYMSSRLIKLHSPWYISTTIDIDQSQRLHSTYCRCWLAYVDGDMFSSQHCRFMNLSIYQFGC